MSFVSNIVLIIIILSLIGCKGVSFNPDFHVGDHLTQTIASERGDIIPTDSPRFDEFACMHIDKIKELKRLLLSRNIGRENKKKVTDGYKQLTTQLE